MPAAIQYYPTIDTIEAKALEAEFDKELKDRLAVYDKNWAYYQGNHRAPLKKDRTGTDDNLIINHIELIIDKGVSGLLGVDDRGMVKGITFEVADTAPKPSPNLIQRAVGGIQTALGMTEDQGEPEQDYLERVWKANASSLLLLDALLNGGICGHVFVKLLPDGAETDDGEDVPRLVVLNPANVSVFWDQTDMGKVLWYRIQYGTSDGAKPATFRQDIVRQDSTWLIYTFERKGQWQLQGTPETWPYPWPPIVDWKNQPNPQSYYGRDDIGTKTRLNDGLNLTASNMQRIIKHHAHPKTIGTGFQQNEVVATAVDGLWTIASPEARVYNLEMQSDLTSTRNMIDLQRNSIYDTARELNPGTVADKLGAITNFGLRVLHADSLAKGGVKRMLAGEGLKRICRHLLELGNLNPRVVINVVWPEPLPSDPLETARSLQIMSGLGLSNDTALTRAGYDPDTEAKNRETQHFESTMTQRATAGADAVNSLMTIPRTPVQTPAEMMTGGGGLGRELPTDGQPAQAMSRF